MSDNDTQFKNKTIQEFCVKYNIQQRFSSVAYPQSNRQSEASKKLILDGLKKSLERAKKKVGTRATFSLVGFSYDRGDQWGKRRSP